jgi:hypothetical protein
MSRIKEKLSKIFTAQIPEFLRVSDIVPPNGQVISTTAYSKIVTVGSTADIIAGDKLVQPAITNTVFVTKVLSSSSIEVSDKILVTLSNIVAQFVRNDSTSNFVKFLAAYYEFLEQDQGPQELLQNARSYGDTDHTTDELLEQFFKNYGNDIPRNIAADKRTFVKHFRDVYKSKGTEEAYKLLFRILYNEDVSFKYPKTLTLKPSDGIWKKDFIMRVVPLLNNPFDLIDTKIVGVTSGATAIVENVLKIRIKNTTVYELYLSKIKGTFISETITCTKLITAPNVTSTIQVIPLPILTKIDIVDGAAGYVANSKILIDGVSTKISLLSDSGKIKKISVLEPFLYSSLGASITYTIDPPYNSIRENNITFTNDIGTFVSNIKHGLIKGKTGKLFFYSNASSNLNLTERNFSVSTVLDDNRFRFNFIGGSGGGNTTLQANLTYTEKATISPVIGIVKESDGYWLTNQGKISELNYIQGPSPSSPDQTKIYYQPYSYVVQSGLSLSTWKNIVVPIAHPAGTELFGEILINNTIDANVYPASNAEIWDYFGGTTDSNTYPFSADMTTYTNSRVTNLSVTSDMVYTLFGYL